MSLLTDLLAYYKLDGNVLDATGAHNGVSHGSPAYPAGKIGTCFDNGANNANYFAASLALGNVFSMACWIKRTGSVAGGASAWTINSSDYAGFYVDFSTATIKFVDHFGTDRLSTQAATLNTWRHVVCTYDGTVLRWYVDGVAAGTNTFAITSFTPDSFCGNDSLHGAFVGLLDEVGFWKDRVLTVDDAIELFAAGAGNTHPFSLPAPTVSSVTPDVGIETGGTAITIDGTGFVDGATVTIGGAVVTGVVFVDSTQLTAISPPDSPGPANVVVTNPDDQTGTLVSGFTYTATPPVFTKFGTALFNLLPPGQLWNREAGSTLRKGLLAIGDEFARIEARALDLIEETDPRTADESIADWERMMSLPDDLVTTLPATLAGRRVAVVQKLISQGGQSLGFFTALINACGYHQATTPIPDFYGINFYPPLITKYAAALTRSGTLRCGDHLSGTEWAYAMKVTVDTTIGTGGLTHAQFEAVIRHATHSHITVVFVYV